MRFPCGRNVGVGRGLKAGALKLRQEILGSVIGKAHVGGDELLVQEGRPQEMRHLLLLRGVARKGQSVTQAGKDKTGNAALKRGVEGEASYLKSEDRITVTDFNVIRSGDPVDVLRIEGEGVERSEKLAWRKIGGAASGWPRNEKKQTGGKKPHKKSVVIFGMKEQGCNGWSVLGA